MNTNKKTDKTISRNLYPIAQLGLSAATSLQALEAKASKAAALAEAARKQDKKKKKAPKEIPPMEREIRAILRGLEVAASENRVAVRETPAKGSSCVAIIAIYDKEDIMRQKLDEAQRRKMREEGMDISLLPKGFQASPEIRYVFYSHALFAGRLGSVAIYGQNLMAYHQQLLKRGRLFGRSILSVDMEVGRRPYLDVKIRG